MFHKRSTNLYLKNKKLRKENLKLLTKIKEIEKLTKITKNDNEKMANYFFREHILDVKESLEMVVYIKGQWSYVTSFGPNTSKPPEITSEKDDQHARDSFCKKVCELETRLDEAVYLDGKWKIIGK